MCMCARVRVCVCMYVCFTLWNISLRAKFLFFQKIKHAVFCLLILPVIGDCMLPDFPWLKFVQVSSISKSRAASFVWKRILRWSLIFRPRFSRAYKRSNCPWHNSRLIVPVSLICNHEAEATELLSHLSRPRFIFSLAAWFPYRKLTLSSSLWHRRMRQSYAWNKNKSSLPLSFSGSLAVPSRNTFVPGSDEVSSWV